MKKGMLVFGRGNLGRFEGISVVLIRDGVRDDLCDCFFEWNGMQIEIDVLCLHLGREWLRFF